MLNLISALINKILIVLCAISGMFCVMMAGWFLMLPVEEYEQRVRQAQAQLAEAEATMQTRLEAEQESLRQVRAQHEDKAAQLAQIQAQKEAVVVQHAQAKEQVDGIQNMPQAIAQLRQNYGEKVRQLENKIRADETDVKICYLTFDDGPNNMTASVVKKFESLDIYGTFFTIGANSAPNQTEILRAEMMGGHTVGNHTYSHAYSGDLYSDIEEFKTQVLKQDQKVYEATGFHMDLFRFPSGSGMCPFREEAKTWLAENGYKWIDWNSTAWDSGLEALDAGGRRIARNVLANCDGLDIAVVLCHDFNYSTYEALDIFVPELKRQGYIFLPLFPQSCMFDEPLEVK